ncbi:MAG: hypothetical protein U0798_05635 [Gemmataceae bacterium]
MAHASLRGTVTMRALGIGLMIFNLLLTAAIGAYLAPLSWSKRQVMNATVAKSYLVRIGLPVEAPRYDPNASTQPITFSTAGGHVVEEIETSVLKEYFGNDQPVNSQKEELERAYRATESKITSMEPAMKVAYLVGEYRKNAFVPGILIYMARNYDERTTLRSLISPGRNDPALIQKASQEAMKYLKDRYEECTSAKPGLEQQNRIATFLANLEPESNTVQKRVILVVGMKQYLKVVGDQAAAYDEIARRVNRKLELDQEFYVREYEMLKKLAIDRAQISSAQKAVENELALNKVDDEKQFSMREGQKTNRLQELDTYRNRVKKVVDANAALETKLQETQRSVGLLLDSILAEEAKLAEAEKTAG